MSLRKEKLKMIKKLLTYTIAITTIVWSVGLFSMPLAVGAATSGDLIKLQCAAGAGVNDPCKAVYYLGADAKRYVFPNEKTYMTWYSDFSGVKIVSLTEMSSYAIGGNVTYRPGVKLVKITTDPKVYAVSANGTLRWVTTAAIAEALYGVNWARTSVEDVSDAFFVNYKVGADITVASDYNKATETSEAATINDDKNLTGGPVATGTSLTVALASDTPASGIVVGNSINNKFTKVNLTASADGDIVIDSLTVTRGGTVASDSPFSSIALIDAATGVRIGNTKTLNSSHQAVFNQNITVAAGTTKSIYLAGNMGATASYAGEIPSLNLSAVTLVGTAAIVGTLPIVGNYQNINGTITIGALSLSDGANNPSASTQKIGTTNYIVSGFKLVASSVEDFKVSQISFKQGGTASDADVANLSLLVDDAKVATVAAVTGGMVTFDLSASPILVAKGKTVQFDLRLDIVSGSARTIRFDVNDESDIVSMGQLYGYAVKLADGGNGATADAEPFWTAPVTSVDRGSLRIGPATLSAANVATDSDQAVLGKFEFEAKGEETEITSLPIVFTITTSSASTVGNVTEADLTNIAVYDENGSIVAGPDDTVYSAGYSTRTYIVGVTSTDTITVPVGLHYYTIKGDLSADWEADDTIVASITPNGLTAKGSTTGLAVTPTPASSQSSATMTIKSAQLSLSTSPSPIAQSIVAGSKAVTFANLILGAEGSGEDVKVTKVMAAVTCDSTCNPAEVSNWSLFDGATELATTNDPDSDTAAKTTDNDEATATWMLSTPLVITKGTSKTLTVKGDISTAATNGTMQVGMASITGAEDVTAKGGTTNLTATVVVSPSNGQGMTFTDLGQLTISLDSTSPKEGLMPASTSGLTFGIFSAFAKYEDVKIEKLYLTSTALNSGGLDQVSKVYLYNGSTKLAEVTPTSTDSTGDTVLIDVTGSPIVVPKDNSILLTVKVDTAGSDYEIGSRGASGQGLSLKINAAGDITAKGAQSGGTITSITITGSTTKNQYLFRSVPTVVPNEELPTSGDNSKVAGGTLTNQTGAPLYRLKVSADSAGPIGIGQVTFAFATSTATTTNWKLYDQNGTLLGTNDSLSYVGVDWSAPAACDAGSTCDSVIVIPLTSDGSAISATDSTKFQALQIGAGTSNYLTLKGDLVCNTVNCAASSNPTGGSVSIMLLGDSNLPAAYPAPIGTIFSGTVDQSALTGLAVDYFGSSFIWTDYWRTSVQKNSSTTASSTEQWMNGYVVAKGASSKLDATSTAVTFSK